MKIASILALLPLILAAQTSTSVTLATAPPAPQLGVLVTLTATVSPSAATGKVTFYDGTSVLGAGTLSSGQAALQTGLLGAGTRSLFAYYSGDSTYAPSTSAIVPLTVHAVAAGGFQSAATYSAPGSPSALVVGYFNGDSKPDLLVGGLSQSFVYTGNADGTFSTSVADNISLGIVYAAVGDFNRDGKMDLAVITAGDLFNVLLGNGDGTFQPPVNYNVGTHPAGLVVTDLNGDGLADVVVVNQTSNNISVLIGNGDGTFQNAANHSVGSVPDSIAAGDFNGDGKPDLVVGNFLTNNVSVLIGNGDGTLQMPVNYSAGIAVSAVVAGDFNGDGKLDLAVASSAGTTVLLGKGDGTFPTSVTTNTGNYSAPYLVGDFNGDGKLDLAVADANESAAVILLGKGDGSFQAPMKYRAGGGAGLGIGLGDFNGDGRTDLAVANYGDGTLSVLLGQAAANPTVQAVSVSPASGTGAFQLFTFTFSDSAGFSDLSTASAVIAEATSTTGTCYLTYNRPQNTLALLSDSGTSQGTISPGGGNQQNSQCTLVGSQSSVAASGNVLTLTLAVGFKAAYAGQYAIFANGVSATGSMSGWQVVGSWTASIPSSTPQALSVQPASGAGVGQTFTFAYSDPNGATDLSAVQAIVNASQSMVSSCYLSVDPIGGKVSLYNDAGNAWLGPLTLGTAGTLSNSQCSVDGNSSGGVISGNIYSVHLALTFPLSFAGAKNVYGYAASSGGANSGWQTLGTWTVGVPFSGSFLVSPFAGGQLPATSIQGVSADIGQPFGLAMDTVGNLYFATSSNLLLKLDPTGALTRLAGTGASGNSGDSGPALSAQLASPQGVAVDVAGNVYVADSAIPQIRKISASGVITTVAGTGTAGFSGDNGPATSAQLNGPTGLAIDSAGNLYIADTGNNRVRKVSAGMITTVAGTGTAGYSGDQGLAAGAQLNQPGAVALDPQGNLYIGDSNNFRVRKVALNGTITTFAGNGTFGFNGDGIPATSANIGTPSALAVDPAGNVYIAESSGFRILRVTPGGTIATFAGTGAFGYNGDGSAATSTLIEAVYGLTADNAGDLFFADTFNNRIRKVSAAAVSTIAGGGLGDGGQAFFSGSLAPGGLSGDGQGNLYASDVQNQRVRKINGAGVISTVTGTGVPGYSGDNGLASAAQVNSPNSIASDAAGNLYIADTNNNRVRKISTSGVISTVAGTGFPGYSGDGGPASSAEVYQPEGVAIDSLGNLYIADTQNQRVRKVSLTGTISTLAGTGTAGYSGDNGPATSAQLSNPRRLAVDSSGNVFLIELNQQRVRRISGSGTITTYAGTGAAGYTGDNGPATLAQLSYPGGLAVDSTGNLYIMDTNNSRIRVVTPAGVISTVAGNGSAASSGDFGAALSAGLAAETAYVDSMGRVYFAAADTAMKGIRMLTPTAGPPLLQVATSHIARFVPGAGEQYILTVSNTNLAGSTTGPVTVTEILPAPLTLGSMTGGGWSCGGSTCTRSDTLNGGASFSSITVTANVSSNAPGQITNQVAVSGGGALVGGIQDLTLLDALGITESLNGPLNSGGSGVYTVTVSNSAGNDATSGTVTVTETVPAGLTLQSMNGSSWTCPSGGNSCTRSDALAGGASYPPITVTLGVPASPPAQAVNQVTVSAAGFVTSTVSQTNGIYSACDVTQDGNTSVADVQSVVNQALGAALGVSDLNHDGKINVVDVQIVINAVTGMGCSAH